ncbi:MAG: metal ABC transporter ATP-binding protein [bacterium]|nr:metal ABC transporter ATP-binding protein [bacterium]
MDNPVIQIRDAVVSYREDVALRGVSLDIDAGEFVGVIGPNGAGKTTLLTLVNGMGRLVSGDVCVLGLRPYGGDGRRVRQRVGYVAQAPRIDPRLPMTVRETVLAGRHGRVGLLRRPGRADHARVDEAIERVGALHLAQRPLGHLSGGEYQRVAIARALAQDPEILLCDEPTASIDPRAQVAILDLVQTLHADTGLTVLYVTHDLGALPEACRRLVLMKDGAIHGDGPRAEMLAESRLDDLYDGTEGRRHGRVVV